MISAHGFLGRDLAGGDQGQHFDKGKLMFRVVDLSPEQGDPGAVFLGVVNEFESVISRAGAPAEDTDDQVWIVLGQFLHGSGSVINNFQERWPAGLRHPREIADDIVINELAELFRRNSDVHIWIKNLEEISEVLAFSLFAKGLKCEQSIAILLEIVHESDRVKAKVCSRE